MLSQEQIEERERLTRICVNALIGECLNDQEISFKYGIPKSTVDRYLKNDEVLKDIYKNDAEFVISEIKEYIDKNKTIGFSKGGEKSQSLYGYGKDEKGKFTGRRR